jgi:hypothetical protein
LSNEEKTNDYENFEKGMTYMKILKKGGGGVEKRGEEETKFMPHAPVVSCWTSCQIFCSKSNCETASLIFPPRDYRGQKK